MYDPVVVSGQSFTLVIVILTVAVFPSCVPSFDLYVKESLVVSDPSWTYVKEPVLVRDIVPKVGEVTRNAAVGVPISTSVSFSKTEEAPKVVTVTVPPSKTDNSSPTVTGGSFWGFTVTLKTSLVSGEQLASPVLSSTVVVTTKLPVWSST